MNEEERWAPIEEFPGYLVSDRGNIFSERTNTMLSFSDIGNGNGVKVNLMKGGHIHTRSVRTIVQQAFPGEEVWEEATTPININGDPTDNRHENIALRPRWFAWKYTRQFHDPIPPEYHVHVLNELTMVVHENVMDAGVSSGELWEYIYQSMLTGRPVYPSGATYRMV